MTSSFIDVAEGTLQDGRPGRFREQPSATMSVRGTTQS